MRSLRESTASVCVLTSPGLCGQRPINLCMYVSTRTARRPDAEDFVPFPVLERSYINGDLIT